jgi:subtilisin family serine protease
MKLHLSSLITACLGIWVVNGGEVRTPPHPSSSVNVPDYSPDQILIMPKPGVSPTALAKFHAAQKARVLRTFEGISGLQILRLPEGKSVPDFIATYERSGLVQFAEPDYAIHATLTPNDPKYLDDTLWALNNNGQKGGTPDADIDAPEAWDVLTSASNIIVAVLDTGVRATHEDLVSNMWVNPLDDGHGWNALSGTTNTDDDNGHGTMMAGVIGAMGNNSKGVVGVAWRVQILVGKCLDSSGNGSNSTLITCIDYARTNGAKIINGSLGGPGFSQAVSNAIYSARNAGIIYVASAGNDSEDIDAAPFYPSAYDVDNIVSVA